MIPFDSSEIANWADKPDAQHQLPELIRRLILATVPTPSLLHIPSGSFSMAACELRTTCTPTFGSHFSRSAGNKG